MDSATYLTRRGQLQTYFDRTAVDAWARLTSDAPVSRIRATVRAGRDQMRETILGWLPDDLSGARVLDAGCGSGALAVAAARRGADVVAIDLSPNLIQLAKERVAQDASLGAARARITFLAGDMLDPDLGRFDHAVAMDSLIHYGGGDIAESVARLATRVQRSIVFTYAPRTPLLSLMHAAGKLFPRGDRSPAIQPIGQSAVSRRLRAQASLRDWREARTQRVTTGFYISQACELTR